MTGAPMSPTVVVGFIPNEQGQTALEHGIAEARLRGGRLLVINSAGTDAFADARRAGEEDLTGLRTQLEAAGIEYEIRQPGSQQSPSETLVEVAEEVDAALIVIGLRHRSLVGKLIMGSNAQRILLDAPCPVLAVKAAPASH